MTKNYRVRLEPINEGHTKLIVKWRNNQRVYNNFIFSEKFTEEMHRNWLKNKVATGDVVQFIIYINENNMPIGSVYFRDIDYKSMTAEYGIFIGEDDYTSKGYGTEAAELALQYAFEVMKLSSVFLRVFEDNVGAIKSYEKVGFLPSNQQKITVIKDNVQREIVFMNCINASIC